MRITIDIDEQHAASAKLVAPANDQATDAGGPPAALLQTLAARATASASQPKAGNDAGGPPQHLLQLLGTAAPRSNGSGDSDGGAARG